MSCRRPRGGALRGAVALARALVGWSLASPPARANEVPGQAASHAGPFGCAGPARRLTPAPRASPLQRSRHPAPWCRRPAALGAGVEIRLFLRLTDQQLGQDGQHGLDGDQAGDVHSGRASGAPFSGMPSLGALLPLADLAKRQARAGWKRGRDELNLRRRLRQRAPGLGLVPGPFPGQARRPGRGLPGFGGAHPPHFRSA